jgi:hypothetical protein
MRDSQYDTGVATGGGNESVKETGEINAVEKMLL